MIFDNKKFEFRVFNLTIKRILNLDKKLSFDFAVNKILKILTSHRRIICFRLLKDRRESLSKKNYLRIYLFFVVKDQVKHKVSYKLKKISIKFFLKRAKYKLILNQP